MALIQLQLKGAVCKDAGKVRDQAKPERKVIRRPPHPPDERPFSCVLCPCPICTGYRIRGRSPQPPASSLRTPWCVQCWQHNRVYLSHHEWLRQKTDHRGWTCPKCGKQASFDHGNLARYEASRTTDAKPALDLRRHREPCKPLRNPIDVFGRLWSYQMCALHVEARDPDGLRTYHFPLTEVLGLSWEDIDKLRKPARTEAVVAALPEVLSVRCGDEDALGKTGPKIGEGVDGGGGGEAEAVAGQVGGGVAVGAAATAERSPLATVA